MLHAHVQQNGCARWRESFGWQQKSSGATIMHFDGAANLIDFSRVLALVDTACFELVRCHVAACYDVRLPQVVLADSYHCVPISRFTVAHAVVGELDVIGVSNWSDLESWTLRSESHYLRGRTCCLHRSIHRCGFTANMSADASRPDSFLRFPHWGSSPHKAFDVFLSGTASRPDHGRDPWHSRATVQVLQILHFHGNHT